MGILHFACSVLQARVILWSVLSPNGYSLIRIYPSQCCSLIFCYCIRLSLIYVPILHHLLHLILIRFGIFRWRLWEAHDSIPFIELSTSDPHHSPFLFSFNTQIHDVIREWLSCHSLKFRVHVKGNESFGCLWHGFGIWVKCLLSSFPPRI